MVGNNGHCYAVAPGSLPAVQTCAHYAVEGYGMEGHLASFLELADMAAADVYRVDEGQAAELEHSSRRLLSQPGLNAGVEKFDFS